MKNEFIAFYTYHRHDEEDSDECDNNKMVLFCVDARGDQPFGNVLSTEECFLFKEETPILHFDSHVVFRSRGGGDEPWNLTVLCAFHHGLVHSGQIGVSGRAPLALEWTPPKLMRAVLERRRNRPSPWLADLEVRQWSVESAATG